MDNIATYDYKAKLAELVKNSRRKDTTIDAFRTALDATTYGEGAYDKDWAVSQYFAYHLILMLTQGHLDIPNYNPSILMPPTKKFLEDLSVKLIYG